ncbi:MAG: ABC transporter ATP-binding protein [Spirochaetales bacterium]
MNSNPANNPLLEVQGLRTSFFTPEGEVKAVDGVSFSVEQGKTLGIVGESGCGKSITSLSIMRLLGEAGTIVGGDIRLRGENILAKSEREMRSMRGKDMSMIFQEPMTSLNPVYTVGNQIAEALRIHEGMSRRAALDKAVEMIDRVGIPSPKRRVHQFPFELSGGMRQRIMIAMALACNPALLIADEPTTALDVTIQAQILELMKKLQEDFHTTILLITHDLGVVAEMCDQVAVMYAGKIVEYADVETLFEMPRHPYTKGLIESLPVHMEDREELKAIPGTVPNPLALPKGCPFAPRCPFARSLCHEELPDLREIQGKEKVRCWIYTERWEREEVATDE